MATGLRLTNPRGGNNHPIAVKQFILDRLAREGEDYFGGLHQAYKKELDRLARERRRKFFYHHPSYFSFFKKVQELMVAGAVEFSGREEFSDDPRFTSWEHKPVRRYVRLARGH